MNDQEFLSGDGTKPKYFKFMGEVERIFGDRAPTYTSCPECKKKVNPGDSA